MKWILITLLAIWLLPIVWVVAANAKAQKAYGQRISIVKMARQAGSLLRWPLGVIDWLRGL